MSFLNLHVYDSYLQVGFFIVTSFYCTKKINHYNSSSILRQREQYILSGLIQKNVRLVGPGESVLSIKAISQSFTKP